MEITQIYNAAMAEAAMQKRGRPVTRTEVWESTHKQVHLLNSIFARWREFSFF